MTRRASADDLHEICLSLPDVELGTSWADRPTYKVRGRGFDLLVIVTPSAVEKQELVGDERLPFFTIDHFNGYNAVLVQQSRLGEIDRDELAEIITDAWAARAPRTLAKKFLQHG
jgi:hypothetical protein